MLPEHLQHKDIRLMIALALVSCLLLTCFGYVIVRTLVRLRRDTRQTLKKKIESLRVYAAPALIRIGKDNDGGYLIADLPIEYDTFLSGGISDDVSFEIQLLEKCKTLRCHAFDPTIDRLPATHPRLQFHKLAIGKSTTQSTDLIPFLEEHQNAIIKMDIEGGEFDWLDSLTTCHLRRIAQLVIEFHNVRTLGRWDLLQRLAETHRLVHLHPNNYAGASGGGFVGSVFVPDIFECTYVRKDLIDPVSFNHRVFPHPLDQKNVPQQSDLILSGPPYTS